MVEEQSVDKHENMHVQLTPKKMAGEQVAELVKLPKSDLASMCAAAGVPVSGSKKVLAVRVVAVDMGILLTSSASALMPGKAIGVAAGEGNAG